MPRGSILPWEEKVATLRRYIEEFHDTLVPQNYTDPQNGFRLGRWVANLRQRANFLNAEQILDLNRLNFSWNHRCKVLPWAMKMDILRRYIQDHGDAMVPKDYVDEETGFRLGGMVDRLRQCKSTLNKVRVHELNELGFCWNKYEAHWDEMYDLLCAYKKLHGNANPATREVFQDKPLGQWVAVQKQVYSRQKRPISSSSFQDTNGMTADRIARLESIGFTWTWRGAKEAANNTQDGNDDDGNDDDDDDDCDANLDHGHDEGSVDNDQGADAKPRASEVSELPPGVLAHKEDGGGRVEQQPDSAGAVQEPPPSCRRRAGSLSSCESYNGVSDEKNEEAKVMAKQGGQPAVCI